ncbi:MAG: proline--tRNA ligase [Candidatus Woesearchaeota archaeon]
MAGKEESNLGITVKKADDFSEWYTQAVVKAGLADYTAVSGCIAIKPYGFAIWEKIRCIVDERLKKLGVKNCYFPLFVPESLLSKEAEHIKGFKAEVAWVDYGGDTKLGERLAVRPTSEAIMYDSFSKWIRSWRELPLKLNQWNNVVRWEFRHPVLFLRTREFLWNEGHTAFATKEEAEKEIGQIIAMYKDVCENYLALFGVVGRKTENEKFAGAEYTTSIEYLLPNGKGVQGPDAHHDGQKFAKAYGIQFLDKDGKKSFVWQNTWAITTRMIGVMVAVHGDDKGLILPPELAPIQVVIVPIFSEKDKDSVMKKVREVSSKLSKKFLLEVDDREYSPGWKFNEWELKGVPIRVEIGPKDVAKDQVVVVRRDNGKKSFIPSADAAAEIEKALGAIQQELFNRSKKFLEENTEAVADFAKLSAAIKSGKMAKCFLCGGEKCGAQIKEKTAATPRCIPSGSKSGKCVICGEEGPETLFAKAY